MNGKLLKIGIPALVIGLAVFFSTFTFIVREYEVALKLRLGEIISDTYTPGLHFRVPILHQIRKFDRRLQTLDSQPERFLTIEKKDVIVDSYAKWRIASPAQYLRSTGGSAARTSRLLSERINTSLRNEFGKRTIQEVVSDDRIALMEALTKEVNANAADLGVEVVDVRVKKIDLPPEVSDSVYQRMRAERERVARDLRAKGAEAAERIAPMPIASALSPSPRPIKRPKRSAARATPRPLRSMPAPSAKTPPSMPSIAA